MKARLIFALLASVALLGCGGSGVTKSTLDQAKTLWKTKAVPNYDLEWSSTGSRVARYKVEVREGSARSIKMLYPNGREVEVHPAETRFYTVDGLFIMIADELAQLDQPAPFGQKKGTKVILRMKTDSTYGYPSWYRRDVVGAELTAGIDVIRFQPL